MNIHFTDETLFEQLMNSALVKVEMGSSLYGLNNAKSDKDILIIYARSENMRDSFLWEHHQLQYKKDGVDYIFTDLHNYIRNLLSGDSTINFEVLHTEEIKNSLLSFLYDNRREFYSYNMLKSYLGLAKRDFKYVKKGKDWDYKKVSHIVRGYYSAKRVYSGDYSNSFCAEIFTLMKSLKDEEYTGDIEVLLEEMKRKISSLRETINQELDSGLRHRVLKEAFMSSLDSWIGRLSYSEEYLRLEEKEISLDMFYNAMEKGIKY